MQVPGAGKEGGVCGERPGLHHGGHRQSQGQGAGGAGNECVRVRLGKRQGEESGIKACDCLSFKKKESMPAKWFIFVYHQPTLLLNINK